jgi:AbrB family looped-hinge helix DNA binding protein
MSNPRYRTVNSRGQVTIPAKLRERFQIRKGTKIAFVEERGQLLIQPISDLFIESMRGILAGSDMPRDLERDRD